MLSPPVLVVDDDEDIRETLALVLDSYGYTSATAASGGEALRWLRSHAPPTLILLDLMMPDMTGFAFRAAQRADPCLASIPTVVMSGIDKLSPADEEQLGDIEVLTKPISVPTLLELLARRCTPAQAEAHP